MSGTRRGSTIINNAEETMLHLPSDRFFWGRKSKLTLILLCFTANDGRRKGKPKPSLHNKLGFQHWAVPFSSPKRKPWFRWVGLNNGFWFQFGRVALSIFAQCQAHQRSRRGSLSRQSSLSQALPKRGYTHHYLISPSFVVLLLLCLFYCFNCNLPS